MAEFTAWHRRLLRFALLGVLIALVAWRTDYTLIARYFHVNLLWASLAVQPLIACGFVFGGERLRALVGEPTVGLFPAIKALILGGGMNVILPGRLSEFLKAAYLRDNCSIPFSTGLAAIFIEKVIDLAILGCVAAISASLYLDRTNSTFLPAMVLAVGILLGLPWLERSVLRLCALLPWRALRAFSERFVAHAAARVRGGAFYRALGYGIAIWLISIAGFALFLYCTDSIRIGVVGAMVVFVMATIGGAVPALPGGFGTFEAGVVFALTIHGYTMEEALPIALALHGSQLLISLAGALFIVIWERIGLSRLAEQIRDSRKMIQGPN